MELPSIVSVRIKFSNEFLIKDYTAKLVKSLLINGNPKLEQLFAKGKGIPPKPVHITPLYIETRDKASGKSSERAVYARKVAKNSVAKPPRATRAKPIRIEAGREYFFYVGVSLEFLDDILLGLSNIGRFFFGNEIIDIKSLSYEISYINVEKESENIYRIFKSGERNYSKIIFMSPTLLKDPLVVLRKKKKKLLLPLPEAVFSTPFLMTLIDKGRLKRSIFLRSMRYIKSVFDIPYTVLKTVNLVWYVYDNEVLPAMIGYVKYFIDRQVLQYAQTILETKYNLDFIDILSRALVLAQVYGVGDGRATGFGHISINFPTG